MATKPLPQPDPLQLLIPRRRGYRILGLSISAGSRRERNDPTFPKVIDLGTGRFAFRYAELVAYAEGLAPRERDAAREQKAHTAAAVSAEVRRQRRARPST